MHTFEKHGVRVHYNPALRGRIIVDCATLPDGFLQAWLEHAGYMLVKRPESGPILDGCFYCRHCCDPRPHPSGIGWAYSCRQGLDTEPVKDVMSCPKGEPQLGFQIGGYYRHMWFEGDVPKFLGGGVRMGGCLELHIQGDAEFPQNGVTQFHLCEFQQLEAWVQFWGKELRRRGWVADDEPGQQETNPSPSNSQP